jgi:hypothetical protein
VTGPLIVDPNDVDRTGQQWHGLIPGLDNTAPDVSGNRPTHAAMEEAIMASQAATERLKNMLGQTADGMGSAAKDYQAQEGQSAGSLKDGTGPLSDINGVIDSLTEGVAGVVTPFITEAASFGGQLLGTGSSLGTSLASLAKGTGTGAQPGVGIGLPPADQDQSHPNDDTHTGTVAAPDAGSHSEGHPVQLEAR